MSWDDAIDGVDRETPGDRVPRALQVGLCLRHAVSLPNITERLKSVRGDPGGDLGEIVSLFI